MILLQQKAKLFNEGEPGLDCKVTDIGSFISDFAEYRHDAGFISGQRAYNPN
jgi:hypothetical protein